MIRSRRFATVFATLALSSANLASGDVAALITVAKKSPFKLGPECTIRSGSGLRILASHPRGGVLVEGLSKNSRWCLLLFGQGAPQLVAIRDQEAPAQDGGVLATLRNSQVNAQGMVLLEIELLYPGRPKSLTCWYVFHAGKLRQVPFGAYPDGQPRTRWQTARLLDDGRVAAYGDRQTVVFSRDLAEPPRPVGELVEKELLRLATDGETLAGFVRETTILCDLTTEPWTVYTVPFPDRLLGDVDLQGNRGRWLCYTQFWAQRHVLPRRDPPLVLATGRLKNASKDGFLLKIRDGRVTSEGGMVLLAQVAPPDKPRESHDAVLLCQDGKITDLLPRLSMLDGQYQAIDVCDDQVIVVRRLTLLDDAVSEVVRLQDGKTVSLIERTPLGDFQQAVLPTYDFSLGSGRYFVVRDAGDPSASRFGVVDVLAP